MKLYSIGKAKVWKCTVINPIKGDVIFDFHNRSESL